MVLDRTWKRAGVLVALAVGARGRGVRRGRRRRRRCGGEKVELSFLVDNSDQAVKPAEALIAAFEAKNPNITIKLETRPQGGEGDNMVKTRLSTQEMTDVFAYNSGSLFQALKPGVAAAAGQRRAVGRGSRRRRSCRPCRRTTRSTARRSAAPSAAASSTTRRSTRSSASRSRRRGTSSWRTTPRSRRPASTRSIQSYGETWTSQLFVLADYHNVAAAGPGLGPEVHGEPGQVRAGAGGRGLPAPRGGQQGGVPEQELRLGQVPARAQHARPGQGRALSGADDHRAEPGDLRPGQDRRRRLLRPARQRTPRTPA